MCGISRVKSTTMNTLSFLIVTNVLISHLIISYWTFGQVVIGHGYRFIGSATKSSTTDAISVDGRI